MNETIGGIPMPQYMAIRKLFTECPLEEKEPAMETLRRYPDRLEVMLHWGGFPMEVKPLRSEFPTVYRGASPDWRYSHAWTTDLRVAVMYADWGWGDGPAVRPTHERQPVWSSAVDASNVLAVIWSKDPLTKNVYSELVVDDPSLMQPVEVPFEDYAHLITWRSGERLTTDTAPYGWMIAADVAATAAQANPDEIARWKVEDARRRISTFVASLGSVQ